MSTTRPMTILLANGGEVSIECQDLAGGGRLGAFQCQTCDAVHLAVKPHQVTRVGDELVAGVALDREQAIAHATEVLRLVGLRLIAVPL